MKNKIIFLDIDGVLNSNKYFESMQHKKYEELAIKHAAIDREAIKHLNRIIKETGAKIVISSSWKHLGLDFLREMFEYVGCVGEIIAVTPNPHFSSIRGDEIAAYLNNSEPSEYVIIDDTLDFNNDQMVKLVQTDYKVGLTEKDADEVIRILNVDEGWEDLAI